MVRGGYNHADLIELARLSGEVHRAVNDERRHVFWLREQGVPWSLIGEALGITKQSAWRKYGQP